MTEEAARRTEAPRSDAELEAEMNARRRAIAERLVISALREQGLAEIAEAARQRATFLADAGTSLAASIELEATYATIARLALLTSATWCIVDIIEPDQTLRRLGILHNDPEKAALARQLDGTWLPEPGDLIGAPLAMRLRRSVIIDQNVQTVIAEAAHSLANLRILERLSIGSLLVVPLVHSGELLGAITFVRGTGDGSFNRDDIEVAERLAANCSLALHNSQLYARATAARALAEFERTEARASLREAEKVSYEASDLMKTMSHELRTPLNAIAGYAELLVEGIYGKLTDPQIEAMRRIQKSEEHLVLLINRVLEFARGESGIDRLQNVSPLDVIDEITPMFIPQLRQRGITFDVPRAATPVIARADHQRVKQILLNVVGNAIKFTPPGGSITVSANDSSDVPGFVSVVVRDTGIGIPQHRLMDVFDPFVQVHDPAAVDERGTGLGLSISRDLARKMGGDISAESAFGAGSVFTVMLPRATPETGLP